VSLGGGILKKEPDGPQWDGYPVWAWAVASKAVVACDGKGRGAVLWAAGPHVRFEVEYTSGCGSLDELGLDDAPLGLSVWEGRFVTHGEAAIPGVCDDSYYTEPQGEFRPLSEDEWFWVRRGVCPWEDNDWRGEAPKGVGSVGD
jgi:hypothetical protein